MGQRPFVILFINWMLFITIVAQSKIGDKCQVARTGQEGNCQFVENCEKVLSELIQGLGQPNYCNSIDRKQVVCCPLPPTKRPSTTESPTANRISQKKCNEYRSPLYESSWNSVGFGQKPVEHKVFRCPIASVPFVVGGVDAAPKEFPHMALLGYVDSSKANNINWACGGSLISDRFILTAGHCINSRIGSPKFVLLGELDLVSKNDDAQPRQFGIKNTIRHPNYSPPVKYNDIALIELNETVRFNQYIRPACLPDLEFLHSERTIASGWGHLDYANKTSSEKLQKVGLEVFNNGECNRLYATRINRYIARGILNETQICAGSHDGGKDTCQGDSGGPLQVFHNRLSCMYSIVGVTSFGEACGTRIPGIYTRVFAFLDWIEQIVWPNE